MSRRLAREITLQTLFQLEFSDINWLEALEAVIVEKEITSNNNSYKYAATIITGICDEKEKIDELISKYAKEWDISRIASIDLNILRIAIYEMYYAEEKIVPNIIINEAVEIAKIYSGDDSPRFINGVLGKVVRMAEEE